MITETQQKFILTKYKQLRNRGFDRETTIKRLVEDVKLMSWEITQLEVEVLV